MSAPRPSWLPDMVNVDFSRGPDLIYCHAVRDMLYRIFEDDFINGAPKFHGCPVWWDQREGDNGYPDGFWHIITKSDKETGPRKFEPERASKLPWCAPLIGNSADAAVMVWNYKEGRGNIRTYIWLRAWDYCVVLEKKEMRRGPVAFLVTAYSAENSSWTLQRKYNNRI
ncbi:MAG: hypothetical protein ACOX9R_08260 [Armatimonadota bacterium]|jgi:hypothetical protein